VLALGPKLSGQRDSGLRPSASLSNSTKIECFGLPAFAAAASSQYQ
jgi:hypothetical protein